MNTELAIRDGQATFDAKQLAALEHLGVSGAARADQAIFFHQCVRTGLDPFLKQIYMIERQGKQTIQTGIDGFRLIARRAVNKSGETLGYADPLWCGEDGKWVDVWLPKTPPLAAKTVVFRDGQPFPAVALLSEYQQFKRDGTPNTQWKVRPSHMLAKCAEALALRMAFPQDLSGLYTTDEMGTDFVDETATQPLPATATRRMSRARKTPDAEPDEPPAVEDVPLPLDEETPITEPQMRLLQAHYKATDRAERLAEASSVLGVDVASFSELSKVDASRLIEWINGEPE